ncbi:hypothetical protein FRC10_006676 [Ceratobasidium sp. 414]|nr:hypothetical protein FRC10_006676 [Ceratobasidium sp. 414]
MVHSFRDRELRLLDLALLYEYPNLKRLSDDIKRKHDLGTVNDPTFEELKRAWYNARDFVAQDSNISEERHHDHMEYAILSEAGQSGEQSTGSGPTPEGKLRKIWQGFRSKAASLFSQWPDMFRESRDLRDPEFVASLQSLPNHYPEVAELKARVTSCLRINQDARETRLLNEYLGKVAGEARTCRFEAQKQFRGAQFDSKSKAALSDLHERLKAAMDHQPTSNMTRIDFVKPRPGLAVS